MRHRAEEDHALEMRERDRVWRSQLRRKHHLVGATILFPLFTAFLTPAGFQAMWLQLPIAGLLGLYLHKRRPGMGEAGAATTLAGLLTLAAAGRLWLSFGTLTSVIFYGLLGFALGISEELRRFDGS